MQIPGHGGREQTSREKRQTVNRDKCLKQKHFALDRLHLAGHPAQGGRGNTSHCPVSAPRICQQKGQESSGGTPGTCQEAAGEGRH